MTKRNIRHAITEQLEHRVLLAAVPLPNTLALAPAPAMYVALAEPFEGELLISSTTIAENQPGGTVIGSFRTNPAALNPVYELVEGEGDNSNGLFDIVGDELRTAAPLDFEVAASHSIRVRVTNDDGLSRDENFTITVTDANDAPHLPLLSKRLVAENQPIGTFVGEVSVGDPDAGDTHTFSIAGGTGQGKFTIDGDELKTNAIFNYEGINSYTLVIRATDAGGLYTDATWTINITNVNEAPTNITLSSNTIAENRPVGTIVGQLSAIDPDAADFACFALVAGAGSTDNALFRITDRSVRTLAILDYETKTSYSIRVRATDSGGLSIERALVINVTDGNDAPTNIRLSTPSVPESAAVGTTVGLLSADDPDGDTAFTFALVGGAGASGNPLFAISGNQLRVASALDFEAAASHTIRVRATDAGGMSFEKVLTITVTDVDDQKPLTLNGTDGNDNIIVSPDGNRLRFDINGTISYAYLGNIASLTINALAGHDYVEIEPGVMGVTILGGDGNDTLTGGDGGDLIYGNDGDDLLSGRDGVDTIYGNFGNDVIAGGLKRDSLMGGLGDDTITGGDGPDSIYGGDGQDLLRGGKGADYIEGRGKSDTIYGGEGNDTLIGGAGSDAIFGEDGDDHLYASASPLFHDTLDGGAGNDGYEADDDDLLINLEYLLA